MLTCSCGAQLELADAEAHAEQHGLEGDTYAAAQLRAWIAELRRR